MGQICTRQRKHAYKIFLPVNLNRRDLGDQITHFRIIQLLQQWSRHIHCIIKEAAETDVQPSNLNREDGFLLNTSCKSLIQTLKQSRKFFQRRVLTWLSLTHGLLLLLPSCGHSLVSLFRDYISHCLFAIPFSSSLSLALISNSHPPTYPTSPI